MPLPLLLTAAAAAAVAAALLLWPLPCCCGLRRHLRGRHLNVEGLRGRLGPAAGRTCTRVLCDCSARAGCLPPVLLRSPRHLRELLGTGGPCGLLGPLRRGRLLEIGRLLDVGTGLCGLLTCRPVRCPACLAAPSATTPGALLLGGRLPEMSVGSTVLFASCRWARSFAAAQSMPEFVQELT